MLLVLVCLILDIVSSELVVINTNNGKIRGKLHTTHPGGVKYYAFKGIRYAEPPKRFEASIPVNNWNGTYDATEDKAICIQVSPTSLNESEDCLYLSVYTPKLQKDGKTNIPVMFWIYGGGFINGNNFYIRYGPDYLLEDNVVVVTVNYRLNMLGFVSTGDSRIPGNNGLKDVILGLQWVHNNIKFFGGDPTQVTVFGESAGACLTSYLIYSPLVEGKGYFQRAITQSGSSTVPFAVQSNPEHRYKLLINATYCRFYEERGEDAVLNCLKEAPIDALKIAISAVVQIGAAVFVDSVPFGPVHEEPSPTAAITKSTYIALLSKDIPQIPIITGITSEEMLAVGDKAVVQEGMALPSGSPVIKAFLLQLELNPRMLVASDMNATQEDEDKFIVPILKKYYFDNPSIPAPEARLIRYISDVMYNRPFRVLLRLMANKVKQYCYVFSYRSELNKVQDYEGLEKTMHAGELPLLFRVKASSNIPLTHQDKIVTKRLARLWTNFAKYGNPTPTNDPILQDKTWPTAWIDEDNVRCLNISEDLTVIKNPKEEQYQLWKELYEKYSHPNY